MDEHLLLVVDFHNVCRLCLNSNGAFSDIFTKTESVSLHEQILRVTGLEATEGDSLPQTICHKCRYIIETAYELCEQVKTSEKLLHEAVNSGADDKAKCNLDENIEKLEDFDNFNEVESYTPTYKESHKRKKLGPKHLTCQICLSTFTSEDKVNQHVQSHYVYSNLTPYTELVKPFSCEKCGLKGTRVQLIKHHREHLGVNPYLCKEPGCNFVAKDLRAHRHHATVHGSRDFVCPTCGASFKRRWALLNHEERLHRAAQAECTKCNVKCKNEPALRAHLKTHERPRRFVCPREGCGRAYLIRGHLAAHEAAHRGDRRFRCARCPNAYTSASLLQRHVKNQHLRRRFWHAGANPAPPATSETLKFADATPVAFTVLDDASSEPPLQMVSDDVLNALAPRPPQSHADTDLHDLSSEGLLFIQVEP